MNAVSILTELQEKLDLTLYGLGKKLGLKSTGHIYLFKNGVRKPNLITCKKIINLGKEAGMSITLDMLRGENDG